MRARNAVSFPSASQPTSRSMRTGWRFGWSSSDSSRESVHFTGRWSSQAASAVCAWLLMSSLPPNAPPLDTSSTVMRSASTVEDRRDLVAVVPDALTTRVHVHAAVGRRGTASVDSGSRNACSMRWVWYTSCTTCALAANAASTSPRAYTERDSTLPSRPHTASSSVATASAGSVMGVSGAYSTSTSAAARRAISRVSATTIASTSPR